MSGNELVTMRVLSACLQTLLLLMSIFRTGVSSVRADVRCYCNLPVCITSGYMCKSSLGVCISDHFGYSGDVLQSRHVCVELLPQKDRQMAALDCPSQKIESGEFPHRYCCKEDMCNYFRQSTVHSPLHRPPSQGFLEGLLSNAGASERHAPPLADAASALHRRAWFRACVVAVPAAGACVLVVLGVMAARMLRADRKHHARCAQQMRDLKVVYESARTRSLLLMPKSASCDVGVVKETTQEALLEKATLQKSVSCGQGQDLQMQMHMQMAPIGRSASLALSTDTACTDDSRDKYFVFDL